MHETKSNEVPTVSILYLPTLKALLSLGGSAGIEELNQEVYEVMKLDEDVLNIPHGDGRSEIEYRLAWVRTRLKMVGYIDNSARGIWTLNKPELDINTISNANISKEIREMRKSLNSLKQVASTKSEEDIELIENEESWKDLMVKELYDLHPDAFERLTQRLLRESGFTQVEVTGKSGDGGIDGKGIARMNGMLSFHVVFQCKRYKGSISSSQIRDFRGAMQGRADKALFITTGNFTRDAKREATRDGAPPIDLLDGDQLCEKLRELRLGVSIEMIEKVTVIPEWFKRL